MAQRSIGGDLQRDAFGESGMRGSQEKRRAFELPVGGHGVDGDGLAIGGDQLAGGGVDQGAGEFRGLAGDEGEEAGMQEQGRGVVFHRLLLVVGGRERGVPRAPRRGGVWNPDGRRQGAGNYDGCRRSGGEGQGIDLGEGAGRRRGNPEFLEKPDETHHVRILQQVAADGLDAVAIELLAGVDVGPELGPL